MQRPTLTNVRIGSTRDALRIFHGVARNRLPLITRRLDAEERRAIVPGNVYVWEERGAHSEMNGLGMERWTDGMGWGPSRVRDDFLFYHQKESEYNEELSSSSTPWSQMMNLYPMPRARATNDADRLIKQTYSVFVTLPTDQPGITRKWHLTAYFSQQTVDSLGRVTDVPGIGGVEVPDGLFRSARTAKGRAPGGAADPDTETVIPPVDAPLASTSQFSIHMGPQPGPSRPTRGQRAPRTVVHQPEPPQTQYIHKTPIAYEFHQQAHARPPNPHQLPSPQAPWAHNRYSEDADAYRRPSSAASWRHARPPIPHEQPSPHPPWAHERYREEADAYRRPRSTSSSQSSGSSGSGSGQSGKSGKSGLVPLETLETTSYPRRDPTDEQLLNRFSTYTSISAPLRSS